MRHGNPPERITVYVCADCGAYQPHRAADHAPKCSMRRLKWYQMAPVEYVLAPKEEATAA